MIFFSVYCTLYSKMVANYSFICVNKPSLPCQHVQNTKEFSGKNEAKGANKHAYKKNV